MTEQIERSEVKVPLAYALMLNMQLPLIPLLASLMTVVMDVTQAAANAGVFPQEAIPSPDSTIKKILLTAGEKRLPIKSLSKTLGAWEPEDTLAVWEELARWVQTITAKTTAAPSPASALVDASGKAMSQ